MVGGVVMRDISCFIMKISRVCTVIASISSGSIRKRWRWIGTRGRVIRIVARRRISTTRIVIISSSSGVGV